MRRDASNQLQEVLGLVAEEYDPRHGPQEDHHDDEADEVEQLGLQGLESSGHLWAV